MVLAEIVSLAETLSIATLVAVGGLLWRTSRDRRADRETKERRLVERTEYKKDMEHRVANLEKEAASHGADAAKVFSELRKMREEMVELKQHVQDLCRRIGVVEETGTSR